MKRFLPIRAPAALLVAALSCGPPGSRADEEEWAGRVRLQPLPKPDFVLADARGEAYDFRSETEGFLTLLFFGFTYCPDFCPVQLSNLATVLPKLEPEVQSKIRVVFVTVDPERDTGDRIREWLNRIHSDFVGLRGSREEIAEIEKALQLPGSVVDPADENGDYAVLHAAQVIAFGADGSARIEYPFGIRQRDWIRDLPRLVAGVLPRAAGGG